MTQNSLQGGKPVYSTSRSKWEPVGKERPDSHELTVEIEMPKSRATVLSGSPFLRRQSRKARAKLARTSQICCSCATTQVWTKSARSSSTQATWRTELLRDFRVSSQGRLAPGLGVNMPRQKGAAGEGPLDCLQS